jgi:hypothetical protein
MSDVDRALETQIANLQTRSGKTLAEIHARIRESGLEKHGEIRDMLKRDLGMGHGDANTVVHLYLNAGPPANDPLQEIYAGPKAALRPVHDRAMEEIAKLGAFEVAPKKAYLSLRRKKQFATIGPATKTAIEIGLNMKGVAGTERLVALPPGQMCQYKVRIGSASEVDRELLTWIRTAYESAG